MTRTLQKLGRSLDFTRMLVLVNILIFVAMVATSGWRTCFFPTQEALLRWGANLGALTVQGQYWRLVTSMFVHAGILHLGLNMYALWVFGPTVSKTFGKKRALAIYFLSGLAGALASTVWNPAQISAGASGALVGTAGAMLAAMVMGAAREEKANRFVQPLVFFCVICASLLYGFFNPDIDNAAHIGGLAGGFLCGFALLPGKKQTSKFRLVFSMAALALTVIAATFFCLAAARADKRLTAYHVATRAVADLKAGRFQDAYSGYDELLKSEVNCSYFVGRAAALIGLKQYERALADCARAIAMNPRDPSPFIVRAKAQHEQGNDIEAIEDLSVVINKSSRHASAYNSRAWSELVLGRFKQALQDANAAVELDSEMAEARDTRGVVLFCLKKYDGALADFAQSIALKPQDGASYFHRALIYDVTGKLQKAALDRDKAKGLGYTPEPWEVKIQSNK